MLFSLFFYNFILFVSSFLAYISSKIKDIIINKTLIYFSFILIILISALRSPSVGTDSLVYFNEYFKIDPTNSLITNIILNLGNFEPGFITINHIFIKFNQSYTTVLIFYYTIIWTLIYKSFKDCKKHIHLVIFFFITHFLFFTFNGFRQAIATAIILFSLNYFVQKKYIHFVLLIIISSLFHYSSLVMLLVFLLKKENKISNLKWSIFFILSIFFPINLLLILVVKITSLLPYYGTYLGRDDFYIKSGFSFGVLYQFILGFVLLFYSNKVIKTEKQRLFFKLSLFGNIFYNLFYSNFFINRIVIYFLFIQLVCFIYIFQYLIENKKYTQLTFLSIIFCLVFIYKILVNDSGVTPYLFNF